MRRHSWFIHHFQVPVLCLFATLLAAAMAAARRFIVPRIANGVEQPLTLANILLRVPVLPLLVMSSFRGAWDLSGSIEARWLGTSFMAELFLRLYTAYQVVEMTVDSGACNTIGPKEIGASFPLYETEASRSGME